MNECSFGNVVALRERLKCLFAVKPLCTYLRQKTGILAKLFIELAKVLGSDDHIEVEDKVLVDLSTYL